ncbi:lipopolysaccharide biosynthesis protein [uncultured Bacteroides sp.]|uniref:lipopolysaccharide biosynthesis protein n=1 Tax=uncultured Bacteroides sp. TaxID=162156 RepID=UPI00262BA75E|nr:lipopolysaccharide biosynthesis protein [uncultured Bacteroides sp.]
MSLGSKVLSGTIWASLDRFGTIFLQFFVNLVLARLLTPADYGCIGMLSIFLVVSQVLVDGGFGSALIQKKEPTQIDYSTIFFWNLLFACFLYVVLFLLSPYIALFFKMPLLSDVLKVLGLILIINSLGIIQNNRLRKQMKFKKISFVNVSSFFISSLVGIYLACHGLGVWSLVIMQLCNAMFNAGTLWVVARWYPSFVFSFRTLKELFGFGGYLLASNILQEICKNLQGLIIGRKFSSVEMGFYSQAKKLDDIACLTLPNVIMQVMFPLYSQLQNDLKQLKNALNMSVQVISFVIFPLIAILILIAHPLICFLYGHKWEGAIPYFQILCVGGLFACLQNVNYYAVAALGKSKPLFRWSFYKWGMLFIFLFVGIHWGIHGLLWGMVISSLNIYLVNALLVSKYCHYSLAEQLKGVLPVFCLSLIVAMLLWLLNQQWLLPFGVNIVIYITVYIMIAYVARFKAFEYCFLLLNKLLKLDK